MNYSEKPILWVNVNGLMEMFGLGRSMALDIGKKSGAVIHLGRRKTLYSVEKVKAYMEGIMEEGSGSNEDSMG